METGEGGGESRGDGEGWGGKAENCTWRAIKNVKLSPPKKHKIMFSEKKDKELYIYIYIYIYIYTS